MDVYHYSMYVTYTVSVKLVDSLLVLDWGFLFPFMVFSCGSVFKKEKKKMFAFISRFEGL